MEAGARRIGLPVDLLATMPPKDKSENVLRATLSDCRPGCQAWSCLGGWLIDFLLIDAM